MSENFEKIAMPKVSEKAESHAEQSGEMVKFETSIESKQVPIEKIGEGGLGGTQYAKKQQDEREKQIEDILAVGLEKSYLSLSPSKRAEFKKEGEKATRDINILLSQTKVNVKKIIDIIKKWLSIIPGLNKFFMEQEAKIKTDEILKIKKDLM